MEEKTICKTVLLSWLKEHENAIIAHHVIDSSLYEYGKENFGVYYSAATYHRNFCWLKNEPATLRENGIELEQLVEGSGKVNKWRVNSIQSELVLAL